ncbi:hypothetical protein, partial [Streptomyces sp. NPDC005795]|uniref:hypothetical protein n=1 Tax=Streptomyces sp. NPDC005795 TaxID=3154677 RepID=UPI0033F5811F
MVRTPSTSCEAWVLRWNDNGPVGPGSAVRTVSREPSAARRSATASLVSVEIYRALVEDRTRVSGPADPETLRARHGLGVNL